MINNSKIVMDYYDSYEEDKRFHKDQAHTVEYLTTKKYIDSNLKEGVNFIGHIKGQYGLGQGARLLVKGLQSSKLDFNVIEDSFAIFRCSSFILSFKYFFC